MVESKWRIYNPSGSKRVIVTKEIPGERWLNILKAADCRIEVCTSDDILSSDEIKQAMGSNCDGVIGQLTENWGQELFLSLKKGNGKVYSNYAVGNNNIDIDAATANGIWVGNTPGVLTHTTAEMAVSLTFAAARRLGEAERFMRNGQYHGWLPNLFVGELLHRKTVGVIGVGRIGMAYAQMMIEGHKMDLIYYDLYPNKELEAWIDAYNNFLISQGVDPVKYKQADMIESLLSESDCVSIHTVLDESTHHLFNQHNLSLMKETAVLVNTSRGPVIDEVALVEHCHQNPSFKVGLDVFEHEPLMAPGLAELPNVTIVPHIASATHWTRSGMSTLAAANIAGILQGYPVWNKPDITGFLEGDCPKSAPSILNAKALGL